MSLKCSFGFHSWDGCKCTQCDKTREEQHNWDSNSKKCSKCGKNYKPIKLIEKTNDIYVDDCFLINFVEFEEDRNWNDIPDAKLIIELYRSGKIDSAIQQALLVNKNYPDFHFSYFWLIIFYTEKGLNENVRKIFFEGLKFAKTKYYLCDEYANSLWKNNNIQEAIKWWIKSVVIQISTNTIKEENPFMYLSYIVESLGYWDVCSKLRVYVDRLTNQGRLNSTASQKLCTAASQQGNASIKKAIDTLHSNFLV